MPDPDAPKAAADGLLAWIDRGRTLVAAAVFFFGSWSVLTFPFDDAVVRAIFFGFTLAYAFFFFGWRKGPRNRFELAGDIAAGVLGLAIALYIVFDFEEVFGRAGAVNNTDMVVAGLAIVLTLEATRRTAGLALPMLSVIFLLYPWLYGEWLPGLLRTSAFGLERILTQQYLSLDGILGPAFKVMIEYIFLFIVFGAFLQRFGVTEFFHRLRQGDRRQPPRRQRQGRRAGERADGHGFRQRRRQCGLHRRHHDPDDETRGI